MADDPAPNRRGFLAAATDPRILAWPVQAAIGLGFLVIALVAGLDAGGAPGAAVIAALAWLIQWGVLWLAYRAFLARPWWRRHPRTSALVLFTVILAIAILTSIALPAWAETDGWTVLWRFAVTTVVGALMILLLEYRRDLAEQQALQEQLATARGQAEAIVAEQRTEIVQRMLDMLSESFDAISPDADSSRRLRSFAREQVGPLSHELAASMPRLRMEPSRPSKHSPWREVLAEITSRPLVRPWTMAILVGLLFIFATVESSSPGRTPQPAPGTQVAVTIDLANLLVSLTSIATVLLVTWLASWLAVRLTTGLLPRLGLLQRSLLAVATILGISIVVAVAIALVRLLDPGPDSDGTAWQTRLWVVVPIVAIAFLLALGRSITEVIEQSRRRMREATDEIAWERVRLENTISQERTFFATQVHGPIQSVAAAAALRLESRVPTAADLEQVRSDLETAMRTLGDGPPQHRDITAELQDLIATWQGVCTIYATIPASIAAALESDWVAAGTVSDLLIEAVANAAMHGGAKQVWIEMEWSGVDAVQVVVTDDGSAGLSGNRGLGSALLDALAIRWSREAWDGGVRLDVVVAAPGQSASPALAA